MYPWSCCRTCLNSENLNSIFPEFENAQKYSDAVFAATGLLIDSNDYLPQQMCSDCIEFINNSQEFRKKAIETHKELLKRLQSSMNGLKDVVINISPKNIPNNDIKIETYVFLDEDQNGFDDDRFSDDDNITLNNFKSNKLEDKSSQALKSEPDDTDKIKCNGEPALNSSNVFNEISNTENNEDANNKKPVKRKSKGKEKEKKKREKVRIECEICHKILTSMLSVRNHNKIHAGFDIVCEHCGKKFISRYLLMQHCRAKHGYEKTDKCSFCDYRASNAEQVKIHERLHTGEKPFKCSYCDSAFIRRSNYLQHIPIHLTEKTAQCTLCPKRFKSIALMQIHRHKCHRPTTHSFRCDICGRSFSRRRNVVRHVQLMHKADPATSVQRVKNIC